MPTVQVVHPAEDGSSAGFGEFPDAHVRSLVVALAKLIAIRVLLAVGMRA
jgi:hypothetical protein